MIIDQADLNDLIKAKMLLENPSIAAKITNLLGTPIEKGFELLPDDWKKKVGETTQTALTKAVRVAVFTMRNRPGKKASNRSHKLFAAATGGVGGFFGLPALAVELPVSTAIILRSITNIARSEGENVKSIETKLACIEVFALGGPGNDDDASESGYFTVRAALARSVAKAAKYFTEKGLADSSASVLSRLITLVAQRFSVQVSEKAAAQAIPAIGAAGGGLINTLFIEHFQDLARGHFIIRRLERTYGKETVAEIYKTI